MARGRRSERSAEAMRITREHCSRLGGELRQSRRRRRLTQRRLAERCGVSQSLVSRAERGLAVDMPLATWQQLFVAVDRRLVVDVSRDADQEPADAGHLGIQELLLRVGRQAGYAGTFELRTRADSRHSVDVALRDDRRRRLLLLEGWNTIGNVGAAARSTSRKVTDMDALAAAAGGERPYRVASCWVVRATARNRALVTRYPELFTARFPGSSVGWVKALTEGTEPPAEPGLVWCDVACTRLFAWRRRPGG